MKPSRRLLLSRATFTGFLLSLSHLTSALAAPKGEQVAHGSASFQERGNITTIRASNGSVINYSSFDIGKGETVRFIQPGSGSRVLNRVNSADPTQIFGQLQANGSVYLLNPNGIYFQNGSMLNVGHLYAAAGHLSDTEYLAGKNHFSDLTGEVVSSGSILANGGVHLFGEHVANYGNITSKNGLVVLASGSDVLVGQRDSHIYVRANPAAATAVSTVPGVQNAGQIKAPRTIMGAADMYAVAINNTGVIRSKQITLDGGKAGAVNVSGTLDASSQAAKGVGGKITVTGQTVALKSATLDASGAKGGGTVLVGGGFQGKGPIANAEKTSIDAASVIKANATVSGNGGKVAVWSEARTDFQGTISATGARPATTAAAALPAARGGTAEVSSKGDLGFLGTVELRGTSGAKGKLLLDPDTININKVAPDVVNPVHYTDNGDAILVVSSKSVGLALGSADVSLEAKRDINVNDSFTGAGAFSLTLHAGHSVNFNDAILTLKGSLTVVAGDPNAPAPILPLPILPPAIKMDAGSKVDTTANNSSINFQVTGGGMTLNNLQAGTGTITLTATDAVTQVAPTNPPAMQAPPAPVIGAGALVLRGVSGVSYTLTNAGNQISHVASDAEGAVALTTGSSLTVGTFGGVDGIKNTVGANVSLIAGGAIALNQAIDNGAANVRLVAGGSITQGSGATVATGVLGVRNTSTTAGSIDLSAANNSFAKVAGDNAFSGGDLLLVSKTGVTVDTLAADATALAITGLTVKGNGQLVVKAGGDLALNQAVKAHDGSAYLVASGNVTQGGAGVIDAQFLGVRNESTTLGTITLAGNNTIGFTSNSVAGGVAAYNANTSAVILTLVSATKNSTLNVASLDAVSSGGSTLFTATNGISTAGSAEIDLRSVGDLTLSAPVNATATGTVRLRSEGDLTQTGLGVITAGTLGVLNASTTVGNITLTAANQLRNGTAGTFAGTNMSAGGTLSFNNAALPGLSIDTVAAAVTVGSFSFAAINGVTTSGGDIRLTTAGDLTLQHNVTATGANVLLSATGTVVEVGGTVDSAGLALVAAKAPTLIAGNTFTSLAARITNANEDFVLTRAGGLKVTDLFDVTGVSTVNGKITLQTDAGLLEIASEVNSKGAAVTLYSVTDAVTETGSGRVLAGQLQVTAAKTSNLTGANSVPLLSADISGASSDFAFVNTAPLTIGTVGTQSGITAAGYVRLQASGNLLQNSDGLIKTAALTVRNESTSAGRIQLTFDNEFSKFSASNLFSGGSITVVNTLNAGLSITNDTSAPAGFTATNGIAIANGTALLGVQTALGLSIDAQISDAAGTVLLHTMGGISQADTVAIKAAALGLFNESTLGGGIVLKGANQISKVGALDNSDGQSIAINGSGGTGSLAVTTIGAFQDNNHFNFQGVDGLVVTGSADIGVSSGGALSIERPIVAGAGIVRLVSHGSLSQTSAGTITAATVGARNEGNTGNIVLKFEAGTATVAVSNKADKGRIILEGTNTVDLSLGLVSQLADASFAFTDTNGVSATGVALVGIKSAGTLSIKGDIGNSSGTVLLSAGGEIKESGGAKIQADVLGVRNESATAGTIDLSSSGNQINSLAAYNAASAMAITVVDSVGSEVTTSIAERVLTPTYTFAATGGVLSSGGAISLSNSGGITVAKDVVSGGGDIGINAGSITLGGNVDAGGGTVRFVSNGGILQNGAGIISASALSAINDSAGSIDLGKANHIDLLAAQNSFAGGFITVTADTATLTVGQVDALMGVVSTKGGNPATNVIRLTNSGDIVLQNDVVSSSADVKFTSTAGTLKEGAGRIKANGLALDVYTAPDLTPDLPAVNVINRLAVKVNKANEDFAFSQPGDLIIGKVLGVTGVSTNQGAILLESTTMNVTLDANGVSADAMAFINSGAKATILSAPNGTVTEWILGGVAAGVKAGSLLLTTKTAPSLGGKNEIDLLAATVSMATGKFIFSQDKMFTVGRVLTTVDGRMFDVSGVTSGSDIALTSKLGSINLDRDVVAQFGGPLFNVTLSTPAGGVNETTGGVIANTLVVTSLSGDLLNGPNHVAELNLKNTGNGDVKIRNLEALKLVSSPTNPLGILNQGVGEISLTNFGTLQVAAPVSAEKGAVTLAARNGSLLLQNSNVTASTDVTLDADGGIQEKGTGIIIARSLTTKSGGLTDLHNDNQVSSFDGESFGDLVFFNALGSLTVEGATADGDLTISSAGRLHTTGRVEAGGLLKLLAKGTMTIDGPIDAGGDVNLAPTGAGSNVIVHGSVEAGGGFNVTASGYASIDGTIKAGSISVTGQNVEIGDATADSGNLTLQAVDGLYLNGTTYGGDNVFLNPDLTNPRIASPLASIFITSPQLVTITANNSFAVGFLQNLLASGSLTINAGTATLGDTAARGALTVTAGSVVLLDRDPDGSSFLGRHDRGLNIVANTIDFGGASLSYGGQGNGKVFFAVGSGTAHVARISGASFFVDARLDEQFLNLLTAPNGNFTSPTAFPFQPLTGGSVDAEVVAALAGALPEIKRAGFTSEAELSAADKKKLAKLGVQNRDPNAAEKQSIGARRALFNQLTATSTATNPDYQVVVNRIAPNQVVKVLGTYDRIFGPKGEQASNIEHVLSSQYNKYQDQTGDTDMPGFGNFLVKNRAGDAEARNTVAVLGQLRELFTQLGKIGLTSKEVELAQDAIASSLEKSDLSSAQILELVGTRHAAPPPAPTPLPSASVETPANFAS